MTAIDRTKVERQRRYRQRLMQAARTGRTQQTASPAHVAELCGPEATQDADVAAAIAEFVETIRPAVFGAVRRIRRIDPERDGPSWRAATAIGALVGIEPDPVQGATWADLHDRIAEAGIGYREIGQIIGAALAARLPSTRDFGDASIALDSAYDLKPLLDRLGMWRREAVTQ